MQGCTAENVAGLEGCTGLDQVGKGVKRTVIDGFVQQGIVKIPLMGGKLSRVLPKQALDGFNIISADGLDEGGDGGGGIGGVGWLGADAAGGE